MKKLLVLVLAVVLTLSLVAVVSAATFDPFVGGRVTWAYLSSDATENTPDTVGNSGLKMLLKGKIKDDATGTWASIGAKLDGWAGSGTPNTYANLYDFGIDKIGGSNFYAWYTNWENENAKRGQDRIRDIGIAKFHSDPNFDHALANSVNIDYKSDNFILNLGYVPNKRSATTLALSSAAQAQITSIQGGSLTADEQNALLASIVNDPANYVATSTWADKNEAIAAFTVKFDGGNVHGGYYDGFDNGAPITETNVGAEFKAGIVTLKADYTTKSPKVGDAVSEIQAAVSFDELKLDFTVLMDDKYTFATDGGMGYQVRYSGLADGKFTIAYRALTADNDNDAKKSDLTDFYIGYKFGVFETRLGFGTQGSGAGANDVVYAGVYASLW